MSPPREGVPGFTVAHRMKENRNILVDGSRLPLCQSHISSEPPEDLSVKVQALVMDESLLHLVTYLYYHGVGLDDPQRSLPNATIL